MVGALMISMIVDIEVVVERVMIIITGVLLSTLEGETRCHAGVLGFRIKF